MKNSNCWLPVLAILAFIATSSLATSALEVDGAVSIEEVAAERSPDAAPPACAGSPEESHQLSQSCGGPECLLEWRDCIDDCPYTDPMIFRECRNECTAAKRECLSCF